MLPISKEINRAIIETYEYLQTIPTQKERQKHLKAVEKGLKEQYTPRMKKLSFAQGKLLIKLVDRQTHSTSYELVKAFMGPFKAGFYQTFAALFGASLKKQYDPTGDDALAMSLERVLPLDIQWIYLISDLVVLLISLTYIPVSRITYSLLTVVLSGQIIGLMQKIRFPEYVESIEALEDEG